MDQVRAFETALRKTARPERAEYEKKYLKSSLRFIGNNAADVRKQFTEFYRANKDIDRASLDELVDKLWRTDCHELRSIAIGLMVRYGRHYDRRDLPLMRQLVIDSAGWAHVDWISTDLVGAIYSKRPEIAKELRKWSVDKDFWVRRASMLTLLDEARHGNREAFELFSELASRMTVEKEFFIRKAIGWILREVSKKQPEWTFEFLSAHSVSGLTMREGSKYLPEEMKSRLSTDGS